MPTFRPNLAVAAIFALALSASIVGGCSDKNPDAKATTSALSPCLKPTPCHLDVNPNDGTQKHHVMVTAGTASGTAQSSVEWCYKKTDPTDVFTVAFPSPADSPLDLSASLTSTINTSVTPNTNCIGPIDVTSYAKSSAGVDGFKYSIQVPKFPSIDPHIIVVGGTGKDSVQNKK
jgi:hypothetical protein